MCVIKYHAWTKTGQNDLKEEFITSRSFLWSQNLSAISNQLQTAQKTKFFSGFHLFRSKQ